MPAFLFLLIGGACLKIGLWATKPPKKRGSYPELLHHRMKDRAVVRLLNRAYPEKRPLPIDGDAGDATYEEEAA